MSRTMLRLSYLLTLANRNDPICVMSIDKISMVMSLNVAKASKTRVAVAGVVADIIALTFVN